MKAVAASLVTAAVLVGAAWAGNVTPAQFAKLNARVAHLQGQVNTLSGQVTTLSTQLACVVKVSNAQQYTPYLEFGSSGWPTKSGDLNVYAFPSSADGLAGSGYLVASDVQEPQC